MMKYVAYLIKGNGADDVEKNNNRNKYVLYSIFFLD